jgi:hypothetical protein
LVNDGAPVAIARNARLLFATVVSDDAETSAAVAAQREAGEDLADDPLRDEGGDVGRPHPSRDDLDDVCTAKLEPFREATAGAGEPGQ